MAVHTPRGSSFIAGTRKLPNAELKIAAACAKKTNILTLDQSDCLRTT